MKNTLKTPTFGSRWTQTVYGWTKQHDVTSSCATFFCLSSPCRRVMIRQFRNGTFELLIFKVTTYNFYLHIILGQYSLNKRLNNSNVKITLKINFPKDCIIIVKIRPISTTNACTLASSVESAHCVFRVNLPFGFVLVDGHTAAWLFFR